MELTKEQKEDLKALKNHRWFKIMLDLAKEMEIKVLSTFKNVDLTNQSTLAKLWKNQNYLKWIEDFINVINTQDNKIVKKNFED